MKKKTVCVLFGGISSEHEVSKVSVTTVLNNIDKEKYEVHTIGITKLGEWLYYNGPVDKIPTPDWEKYAECKAIVSPDRSDKAIIKFENDGAKKIKIDVAYPVLHGKYGEDGTIQGLFEMAGIPCVGSGVLGSAACMDKGIAKILFQKAEIPQADWVELKAGEELDTDEVEKKLGYPCFVKPSRAGSSIGVTKANNKEELVEGVKLALEYDYKVIIEEAMVPCEVESGVMGNLAPIVAEIVGEIKPAKDFYDFEAKYEDENSQLIMPANVDKSVVAQIREYAKKAYKICECRGYARCDFFVDKAKNQAYLNEINTIPGFTPISMYPKIWEKVGVGVSELIDRHIQYAISREDL